MKKITAFLIILALLCGCSDAGTDENKTEENAVSSEAYALFNGDYSEDFCYSGTADCDRMAVSGSGRLVTSKKTGSSSSLMEYALDGSIRKIGEYGGIPETMAFMGEELYISRIKWGQSSAEDGSQAFRSKGFQLYKLNYETGKCELAMDFDIPLATGHSMSGNKDELYLIHDDDGKGNAVCNYPGFHIQNLSVYRIHNGECEKVPVDFPTAVCARKDGGAVIAACDDDGYYVTRYINGELTEKVHTNNASGFIDYLADVDGTHIVFSVFTGGYQYSLCNADVNNMQMAELIPNTNVSQGIFSAGGLIFFKNFPTISRDASDSAKKDADEAMNRGIRRIDFQKYFKGNDTIKFLCAYRTNASPFGCGYNIEFEDNFGEEIALKILALDKDFDLTIMSTADPMSYSVKKQGSFYPLNGVPGIKEYLDNCFPSVREAFTDENGDIWALPLRAESYYLYRNTGDADFSQMKDSDFIDYIENLSDEDFNKTICLTSGYIPILLSDYISKHDTFDTPELRTAAEKIKNSKNFNLANGFYESDGNFGDEEQIAAILSSFFYSSHLKYGTEREMDVFGLPCIDGSNTLQPFVHFICVNPYSAHLDDVLDYISKLAEYQLSQSDSYVLYPDKGVYHDNDVVRQMAAISENAKVVFTYPEELYWEDFMKYLSDEISLDDFIKEADRKLQTYLNE